MSSTTSASASATSSAAASASSSSSSSISVGSNLKVVGIILAVSSGVLIGSSFVFKKKGLLRSQAGGVAGEGVAYLKSPLWWTGMTMMILGELCNFAAYAFVEALVVTPLGALSVVICAILSSWILKEKLTFFGWLGCILCILGSVIIAFNGPSESSTGQIREFEKLFIAPGFLVYASVLIAAALVIIFYFGPKYGKKSMLWYIMVCSMIGGISVSVTTGLGSAIVTTAMGDNQFNYWFIYFLMAFVAVTLLTEVYYLNVALALFNTAMVTPTYYVIFTFFSMVTTIILFKGLSATVAQILTLVMGFLVICCGITILQMSKIDPTELGKKLDRRSTLLLQASRSNTLKMDEKDLSAVEDPGIDSIRGSFGPIGSIIRARSARRMSMSSHTGRSIYSQGGGESHSQFEGLRRHQLYDAPVPSIDVNGSERSSVFASSTITQPRTPTIKFGSEEVVHKYPVKGRGSELATHERRDVSYRSTSPSQISMNTMSVIDEEASSKKTQGTTDGLSIRHPQPQRASPGLPLVQTDSDFEVPGSPRTAPATMFVSQKNLPRDPFTDSPATSIGTSFVSATSPLPSRSRFSPPSDEESRSSWRYGRGHKRTPSDKKYPKGGDDREESVSLVRSPSIESGTLQSDEEDPTHYGGIRLVESSSGRF